MNEEQRKALVAELAIEFNKIIEAKFESLVNPRLEQLEKNQQGFQVSIDRIDTDMGNDRKDIGDLKIHMGTIRNQFQEIRELFSQQTRTIVNKVEDKITTGINSVSELTAETIGPAVTSVLDDFVSTNPPMEKKKPGVVRRFLSWLGLNKKRGDIHGK